MLRAGRGGEGRRAGKGRMGGGKGGRTRRRKGHLLAQRYLPLSLISPHGQTGEPEQPDVPTHAPTYAHAHAQAEPTSVPCCWKSL